MKGITYFSNNSDKRNHKRAYVNMLVNYSDGQKIFTDYLKDISMGGARVETLSPPQKGVILTMTIPTDPPIKLNGKIKWVTKQKFKYIFGIEFDSLNYAQESLITDFLTSLFWTNNDYLNNI
jgi:hypothetical protein